VYHFFSPQTPAQQQLANFRNTVSPRTQDLIPIVDVEVAPKRRSQIVPFLKRLRTFVNGVEKYFGCKPIIYTSQSFYNKFLVGKFLDCPFMFAKYSNEVPQVTDNPKFLIWQFTASGRIRGISGDVDRSCLMNGYTLDDILYKRQ
jgi:lysozyme